MVNKYIFYPKATEDLDNIFKYISKVLNNLEGAIDLINKFQDKFDLLLQFPEAYPIIEHVSLISSKLRKCMVDNFLVIYLINKELERIEIVRIVYKRYDYLSDL